MGLKLVRIGDGLSSPCGGVVALWWELCWDQGVAALMYLSHSPTKSFIVACRGSRGAALVGIGHSSSGVPTCSTR
jgi:hypothetical protein